MKWVIIIDNFSIFVQNNPTVFKVAPVHNNPNLPYYNYSQISIIRGF